MHFKLSGNSTLVDSTPANDGRIIRGLTTLMRENELLDNGGRRTGGDRRVFAYAMHIPERRSGVDRRDGTDRRSDKREA